MLSQLSRNAIYSSKGSTMAVTFTNTVFSANQSETGLFALGSFTGTSLLSGAAPVTITGTIDMPNSVVTVNLNALGLTAVGAQGTYIGFSPADANGNNVYYFAVTGGGLITPVTIGVTTAAALPTLNVAATVNTSAISAPACFVTGTRIRTVRGEVPVEALAVGDVAITASGDRRPIIWIGYSDVTFTDASAMADRLPIRIVAGAMGKGLPARDLLVSPGHRLFIDGGLVEARLLVNGASIVRETTDALTYWHVELESHDVLLAESLPAESYADVANRASFDNGAIVFGNRPHVLEIKAPMLCAPTIDGGPQLHAIRARLMDRAIALGARTTNDPGLELVADDVVLTPRAVANWQFDYNVPAGTQRLVLRSRTAVPAQVLPGLEDLRALGVCVARLRLDGRNLSMLDPALDAGWTRPEAGCAFRWTAGEAVLPTAESVTVHATPMPLYLLSSGMVSESVAEPTPLRLVA